MAKYNLMAHIMDVLLPLQTDVEPNPQRKYNGDGMLLPKNFANLGWTYGVTKKLVKEFDDEVHAVFWAPPAPNFSETQFEKGTRRLPHDALLFSIVLKLGDFPARNKEVWNDFRERLFLFFRYDLIVMSKNAQVSFQNYTIASLLQPLAIELETMRLMAEGAAQRLMVIQREEQEVCCHFFFETMLHYNQSLFFIS